MSDAPAKKLYDVKGKRVWVSGHRGMVGSAIVRRLAREGCEVDTAIDGFDALAKLADRPPDIVFVDIMMPRLDGYGLLRKLRDDVRADKRYGRAIGFRYHDGKPGIVEGLLSRGDRRVGRIIEEVWRDGGRFDGWSEHFSYDRWMECAERALAGTGVDVAWYTTRERGYDEVQFEEFPVDGKYPATPFRRATSRYSSPVTPHVTARNPGAPRCCTPTRSSAEPVAESAPAMPV